MWAHYGGSHCGVKIDFKIDETYKGRLYEMCYEGEPTRYNGQDKESFIAEILTNKKKCFEYEREYRAIWRGGGDYLPIQILKITLGKRFVTETISSHDTENKKFNKNDNVARIARQFLEIWESGKNKDWREKGVEPPRFYAYKTKYSTKPQPIPASLLEEVEI